MFKKKRKKERGGLDFSLQISIKGKTSRFFLTSLSIEGDERVSLKPSQFLILLLITKLLTF